MDLANLPLRIRFKKVVSLIVAISFIFSNLALADVTKTPTTDTAKEPQITTDPEKIVIPRDFGIVKAKYTAKDSRNLVIHIQDAHCNYEAQSNIIKILECLIKNDGLGLISVEGADGFIDTSWFKAFPDSDIRKEVADYFMKKGEITGPEFLAITSDYPVKLFGAETRSYYIENLNAFTSSYPLKEDTEKYFNQIKAVLNKLKSNIYSQELKDLDVKSQDYESKKMSFTDYVKYLESLAGRYKITLRQYENLFKLVSVLIYEKKIDFNVVDKERAAVIDAITKKLDKEQLKELVNKSLEFKISKISSVEYYDYLKKLALKYGISIVEEYPNLFNYIIYNSVYSRIENEKLFNDIKKFEDAIKEKLFTNNDQRTLDKLSRNINILLGLVNIRLLNGDFDHYKEHKEEFAHEVFAGFIKKMTVKFGFAFEIDPPSQAVIESLPKLEDFYAIAIKRDKALVDNTVQAMKKEGAQVSVLVTGGFHSEGITKLLEKEGMSYLVVCPNITKDVETPYIKILTNQRTPLEEILSDTGAAADAKNVTGSMLAPQLLTAMRIRGEDVGKLFDEVFASKYISEWLPQAFAEAKKMYFELTPGLVVAYFSRAVDEATEEHITSNKLKGRAAKDFRKSAESVKKLAYPVVTKLLEAQYGVGAIRANGGSYTAQEHGTRQKGHSAYAQKRLEILATENSINGAISRLVKTGHLPFALSRDGVLLPDDNEVPLLLPTIKDKTLIRLGKELGALGINFIVIKGLKEELARIGVARDLVFHYGATRRSVYMDEDDFNYLVALPNGVDIIMEGARHEVAHIDNEAANLENPEVELLSEAGIEKIAPSTNVRKAMLEKIMNNIEREMKNNAMPNLPEDAIQLPRGSYDTNWWEEATLAKLALNPTPWGEDSIVPVEEEDGVIKIRITKEMLEKYTAANPSGRNILESFAKYAELGPKSIAGIRHTMNIANIHDTRQVKNSFERLLTTISVALMIKIAYNKGAYFPYQTNYGHEVRYHSNTFQDVTLRMLAAMGFICHTVPDNVPTAIWNTSTMGKFFDMPLSFCGTSSHSESEIDGLKIMDYEGSQFLIDNIEAMIAIQKAIIAKIEKDGEFVFTLSGKNDPRITDALYKLTHNGMFVYKKYQDKTAADEFVLNLVKSVDPSTLHIDCAHGSGYRTLTAFFKEMGLDGVTSRIDWMHTEERSDFGNIGKCMENPKTGKKELFDYGADVTQVYEKKLPSGKIIKYFPVLCTADYQQRFAAMPVGDITLHTDMDNDRLAASQVLANDPDTRDLLDRLGVVYNVINSEKILAVFIPNKFFHFLHEMNFERLTALMKSDKVDKDRKIVVLKTLASTPAVDTWAKRRQEEGHKVEVINTGVGFAKLANVMYRTEGEMKKNPGKDIVITDASGKAINIGTNPIILAAWEESGGIITGITYGFSDILGNSFLAEREKSATESIFLAIALVSKLQHSKAGADLTDYLRMLYDRDKVDTPIDIRFDNKLFTPGASEEAKKAETAGNARKDRIFGAHLALVMAYMAKEISIEEARVVLKDIFNQEYEARKAQGQLDEAFLERYKKADIDSLKDIWFTGDGVMFVFEKAGRNWMVLFRPSGTEPKLKSYGFGKDTERLTIDAWVFAFTENMAGALPGSFTSNKTLMKYWGDAGTKAIDRAQRMQSAWEVYGLVVDPEDDEDLARVGVDRAGLEKKKLVRSFTPPDDHLQIIQRWLKEQGLGKLSVDLTKPAAMPQKDIAALLEAIPDDVYKKLGRTKKEVLDKERVVTDAVLNNVDVDVARAANILNMKKALVQQAVATSINRTMLLNDFAESVGIKKDKALENMEKAGLATVTDKKKSEYELTEDFFAAEKLKKFTELQVASSSNPAMVDLTLIRIQRIILNAANPDTFINRLSQLASNTAKVVADVLKRNNVFPTLVASWRLNEVKKSAVKQPPVSLRATDLVNPAAKEFYANNGVDVEFTLPGGTKVDPVQLQALKEYQQVMVNDMARGAYNYRGAGTRQTIAQFYYDYFAHEYYYKIRNQVDALFSGRKEPLEAFATNGIGANDQFMWSLVRMYNENKPQGAPAWYHVTTARDLARLVGEGKIKPKNTLFIDISRSGATWEGVEVAMRSLKLGFNKRIAIANGGDLGEIAKKAASLGNYTPLIIGLSPDIGGRNMHRKTTIYYTAQTVAGMFLPSMDSLVFAKLNDKFDVGNDFAEQDKNIAIGTGKFIHSAMNLFGAEHIAFVTNTEPLRLVGTEWEQYIMEGSNKEHVISMGTHNLAQEPNHVLANFAASPAAGKSVAMVVLDVAAESYQRDMQRVSELKTRMPTVVFYINSKEPGKEAAFKGGINPAQQAAFDILWTDLVTVLTTLLRVDANSNPNVKVVREYTGKRVAAWREAEENYGKDLIGKGEAEVLISYGKKIGNEGRQEALTVANAAEKGRELAASLAKEGALSGRNRLNLFVGRDDLLDLVTGLRNDAYSTSLATELGWIVQTALFPLWSHKGLEANLAFSTNLDNPLLANRTVDIFFNARRIDAGQNPFFNEKFDNMGIMNEKYAGINGATVHQTNDAMTIPNIKRMAEVSPTILFEFNDKTENVESIIKAFYEAFIEEIGKELASAKTARTEPAEVGAATFDHTIASIMQSSNTGERARNAAQALFKGEEAESIAQRHLIFVKSAIPQEQLATTTAINCANYCADYYNEMKGYSADMVNTYEDAVKLLAKNPDWDKTNTIVGLIDKSSLDRMTAELEKNGMQDKTKLLPMETFDKDQFVPLKGFFDLMSVLVHVNRPLDRPEDRELRDSIKDLLDEIGVRDVNSLISALSVAAYFEDPIKFARNFIIRLLPPTRAASPAELRDRYNAAKKVVESL